jgi:hypothetical protein
MEIGLVVRVAHLLANPRAPGFACLPGYTGEPGMQMQLAADHVARPFGPGPVPERGCE